MFLALFRSKNVIPSTFKDHLLIRISLYMHDIVCFTLISLLQVGFLTLFVEMSPTTETCVFGLISVVETKVYFKPTDTHALLHGSSFHPEHTFKGILESQLLRFRRICSRNSDIDEAKKTLFQALKGRGYSKSFLRKVRKDIQKPDLETTEKPDNKEIVPLISIYSKYATAAHRQLKMNFQETLKGHFGIPKEPELKRPPGHSQTTTSYVPYETTGTTKTIQNTITGNFIQLPRHTLGTNPTAST